MLCLHHFLSPIHMYTFMSILYACVVYMCVYLLLGLGSMETEALGIFSSQWICVELFSIYYWQVSSWVEVSTGNQTGGSSHSLSLDPFPLLLSVSHFPHLLSPHPLSVSFISSWLLCICSRLLLSAILCVMLLFLFLCVSRFTSSECPSEKKICIWITQYSKRCWNRTSIESKTGKNKKMLTQVIVFLEGPPPSHQHCCFQLYYFVLTLLIITVQQNQAPCWWPSASTGTEQKAANK